MTESDLYDATANVIGEGNDTQKAAALTALTGADGWYITMEHSGEKILSTPLTFNGVVYFTTYEPQTTTVGCVPTAGTSRLYELNSSNATPANNLDNSSDASNLTKSDRSLTLTDIGLPPDPVHMRVQDSSGVGDVILVGTHAEKATGNGGNTPLYWYNY